MIGRSQRTPAGSTLVVGGGFLGVSIALGLVRSGERVALLTRRVPAVPRPPGLRIIVGDAADHAVVEAALEAATDVVFCAGSALPAEIELDPAAARLRELAPLDTVLDALRSRPAVRLLYLSSGGTIYGEPGVLPVPESHPLRPLSAYGIIKAEAEERIMELRDGQGGRATALRCANVYGPEQQPWRSQGVIATLIAAARSGGTVTLYGDGLAVRDYLWIDDVAVVVHRLLGSTDLPAAVNVGSGIGTTLATLVDRVERAVGRSIRVRSEPSRPTDLHSVLLDISLLRDLTGFEPTPLSVGLQHMVVATSTAASDA